MLVTSLLLALGALPSAFGSALPNAEVHQHEKRAGAFGWRVIPPSCGIVNPVYCQGPPSTCTTVQNSTQYAVIEATQNSSAVWNYFLPPNDYPAVSTDYTTLLTRCASACYGYGNPGDCQAFYMALNVTSPKQPFYNNLGGDARVTCIMFNRQLLLSDFTVRNGTGRQNATAGNIVCDGTQAAAAGAMVQLGTYPTGPVAASLASSTSVSYSLTVGGYTSMVSPSVSSGSSSSSMMTSVSSSTMMSASSSSTMSVSSSMMSSSATTSSMMSSSSGM